MDWTSQFPSIHRRRLFLEEQIRIHIRMIDTFGESPGGSLESAQLAQGQLEREQLELTELLNLLDYWINGHAPKYIPLSWHTAAMVVAFYTAILAAIVLYLFVLAR